VLSIRPEKIEIGDVRTAAMLSGKVTRALKLGGLMEYAVALPSGETLVLHQQDRAGVNPRALGDDVTLAWRPEDSRLLPT